MILTTLLTSFSETSQLVWNLVIGLIVFFIITYVIPAIKKISSLPPGPWGLPFVGYLPFIGKTDQYKDIDRLAKKYGPVYSVRLGKFDLIVVSDWKHVKESFANDDLLYRPENFSANPKSPSLLEMSGDSWKAHRRLSLHILRDVGMGKSQLEMKVKQEIENFLPTLNSGPIDLFPKLMSTVANNISNLLMGHGLEYDDPISEKLNNVLLTLGESSSLFHVFSGSVPKLVKDNPLESESKLPKILKSLAEFANYMEKEIEIHKSRGRRSQIFEDYIGGYLVEQEKSEKSKSTDGIQFNLETLRQNLVTFYSAGTETISSTLTWAILYLLKYPEYFDKIREEIEKVIGYERQPDYSDRIHMPWTMSFIYETHRIAALVPVNLFRRAAQDTNIGNYHVPKDSLVMFNFYALNRDPLLWVNPEQFDPKRFLAEHETKAVKPPFLVPFSGGRRNCPGEGLANVELFLYLVSIVQKYRIRLAPGSTISLETGYTTLRRPKNMPKLLFEPLDQQKD